MMQQQSHEKEETKTVMRTFTKNVPVPAAGLALGLVSLGILLRPLSEVYTAIGAAGATALLVLLVVKMFLNPNVVRGDFRNPIFASVFGTFFMTIMQLAALLEPFAPAVAFVLWTDAIAGHLILIAWFTISFGKKFSWDDVFPTYFIAYVGIIVATVTAPAFEAQALGEGLFFFGFACYAVLLAAVTYRLATRPAAAPARPLICIYTAPMSLSLTGYLSCFETPNPLFVAVLAILAQALLVFVIFQLPGLLKLLHANFYPSVAAMTFPFVISATALGKTVAYFAGIGIELPEALTYVVAGETVLAAAMVLYATVRYLGFFKRIAGESTSPAEVASRSKASATR